MTTPTTIPPTIEQLLCRMNDHYEMAGERNDHKTQIQLLRLMAPLTIHLHKCKHKKMHYMTSIEALKSLTPEEHDAMTESVKQMALDQGYEEYVEVLPDGSEVTYPMKPARIIQAEQEAMKKNVFLREALEDKAREKAGLPPRTPPHAQAATPRSNVMTSPREQPPPP